MSVHFAKKIGMTRIYEDNGRVVPVTILELATSVITQIKTTEKDGIASLQIAADPYKKASKNQKYRHITETPLLDGLKVGDQIPQTDIQEGVKIQISGVSKGKGFQGGVKRWGFATAPSSHGHKCKRQLGSLGTRKPRRTKKGKKFPGRMGCDQVTIKKIPIVRFDNDKHLLAVKGPVPGANGSTVKLYI